MWRRVAASTSMRSTPVPNRPMARSCGNRAMRSSGTFSHITRRPAASGASCAGSSWLPGNRTTRSMPAPAKACCSRSRSEKSASSKTTHIRSLHGSDGGAVACSVRVDEIIVEYASVVERKVAPPQIPVQMLHNRELIDRCLRVGPNLDGGRTGPALVHLHVQQVARGQLTDRVRTVHRGNDFQI